MLTNKRSSSISFLTLVWALTINIVFAYFVYHQVQGLTNLDKTWVSSVKNNVKSGVLLSQIEGGFGYVGFIHDFKNYVLRGDEQYYLQARERYEQTSTALAAFKALLSETKDKHNVDLIRETLDEYYENLEMVKLLPPESSAEQRDKLAKVSDDSARRALSDLRKTLVPKLEQTIQTTGALVQRLTSNVIYNAFLLIPFFLISTFVTIKLITKLARINAQFTSIFDLSPDGIIYTDASGRIIQSNGVASQIFGYNPAELRSLSIEDLLDPTLREKHKEYRNQFVQIEQSRQMLGRNAEIRGLRKDGEYVELSVAISARTIDDQVRSVCLVRDISEQIALKNQAEKDHLTEIYNRRSLDRILDSEITRSIRKNTEMSLLLIDIDNFKAINDAKGHATGDKVLITVVEHLKQYIRAYDYLGRWGGDEFLMLCPELDTENSLAFAERIRQTFADMSEPKKDKLTLSIGIATLKVGKPQSREQLLELADKALYQAKNRGRNTVVHESLEHER